MLHKRLVAILFKKMKINDILLFNKGLSVGKVSPNAQLNRKLLASVSAGLLLGMLESQLLYLLRMERNNAWNQDYRTSFSKSTA